MGVKRLLCTLALPLSLGLGTLAHAQLPAFPGAKTLESGPNPVGTGKNISTTFIYRIDVDVTDDTKDLFDVVPAEFDVAGALTGVCTAGDVGASCLADAECDTIVGVGDGVCQTSSFIASCGTASSLEQNKPNVKLRPDFIYWDLDGCVGPQSLTVSVQTDKNPGHTRRQIDYYEPTSCGPLYLNDGAVLFDPNTNGAVTEPSNALYVATCPNESDLAGCIDGDLDGWTLACGDTVDNDPSVFPGASEICGDGKDNNLDGQVDEGCAV